MRKYCLQLIGPIRIQTAESIVYTEYGESIIEERIELIGYGPRDKTKRQIRLKPRVKRVTPAVRLLSWIKFDDGR